MAREAIESGRLPTRPPDRRSDSPPDGASCTVCMLPITPQSDGYELEFALDGRRSATHFLHIPCFVAWESQSRGPVSASQTGPHDEKTPGNGRLNGEDHGSVAMSRRARSATCCLPTRPGPGYPSRSGSTSSQAIAARDEAALRALYERSHRIVFTLIMRIAQNRQTAEELTIDVFHDVWRRAPEYDAANGPVLGWMLNQARSRAIDRVRHEHRQKRVNPLPHEPFTDADESLHDEAIDREELARKLRKAVNLLTPDEQKAIEAAFFSGMSYAEVAAHLQEPLGTIKTRIRSGLGKLREHLGDE